MWLVSIIIANLVSRKNQSSYVLLKTNGGKWSCGADITYVLDNRKNFQF